MNSLKHDSNKSSNLNSEPSSKRSFKSASKLSLKQRSNNSSKQRSEQSSTNLEADTTKDEMEEYLTKDPVAKFQFEYNRNTCFGNDVPEISVPEQINEPLCIAPGEGKIPTNLLMDDDWDMKSHPCLDPVGQNNLNREREIKLSALQFFEKRLLNVNKDLQILHLLYLQQYSI